jgi:hypothetical protein
MVYTGGFFDGSGTRKACHGKVDEGYPKYGPSRSNPILSLDLVWVYLGELCCYHVSGAVFLEFQQPVGTVWTNELREKARTDTILRPGEVYENWVRLTVKDPRL